MFVCSIFFMRTLSSSVSTVTPSTTFQLYLFIAKTHPNETFYLHSHEQFIITVVQNKFVFQDWIVRHYHFPEPILGVNGAPETCSYKLWLPNERHYGSISVFYNNIGCQGFYHETFIWKRTQLIYKEKHPVQHEALKNSQNRYQISIHYIAYLEMFGKTKTK